MFEDFADSSQQKTCVQEVQLATAVRNGHWNYIHTYPHYIAIWSIFAMPSARPCCVTSGTVAQGTGIHHRHCEVFIRQVAHLWHPIRTEVWFEGKHLPGNSGFSWFFIVFRGFSWFFMVFHGFFPENIGVSCQFSQQNPTKPVQWMLRAALKLSAKDVLHPLPLPGKLERPLLPVRDHQIGQFKEESTVHAQEDLSEFAQDHIPSGND